GRGSPAGGPVGGVRGRAPRTDMAPVGRGGGSSGGLARDGARKAGPRSAGAPPGPMCYGRGGDEPTTTDAHLALGRIPPRLLGGEIPLDRDAATRGLERLGAALGLHPLRTAEGILEITAWNQANAIREVSVRRGLDPRDYTLVAFGGSSLAVSSTCPIFVRP